MQRWGIAAGVAALCALPAAVTWIATSSAQQIWNPIIPVGANLIQNGEMVVDQPNAGATVTVTGANIRSVDRWYSIFAASTSGAGNPTVARQNVSAGLAGFGRSVLITVSGTPSTTTPAGLQFQGISQRIEGPDGVDLGFGTSSAVQLTVSLWLKSSITNANVGIGICNSAADRCLPHICNIPTSATWTKCSFTFRADTTGTWNSTPGTRLFSVSVVLAGGSTFQGTADTWNASAAITTSAQTQFTDTASATLEVTGVKVERGGIATAFVPTPFATLLSQLQRYYRKSFALGTAPAQNAGLAGARCVQNPIAVGEPSIYVPFDPIMMENPTVVTYNPSAANSKWRNVTAGADVNETVDVSTAIGTTGVQISTAATTATLGDNLCIHYSASVALF